MPQKEGQVLATMACFRVSAAASFGVFVFRVVGRQLKEGDLVPEPSGAVGDRTYLRPPRMTLFHTIGKIDGFAGILAPERFLEHWVGILTHDGEYNNFEEIVRKCQEKGLQVVLSCWNEGMHINCPTGGFL